MIIKKIFFFFLIVLSLPVAAQQAGTFHDYGSGIGTTNNNGSTAKNYGSFDPAINVNSSNASAVPFKCNILYDFSNKGTASQGEYHYDEHIDDIAFQIEKKIRPLTSGKVLKVKLEAFNSESIFLDYLITGDSNDSIELSILGGDGLKFSTYKLSIYDVIYNTITGSEFVNLAIKMLTDKFLSDEPTLAKINNQKETMQNTYRNDQERMDKLMYELQFYQKERERR